MTLVPSSSCRGAGLLDSTRPFRGSPESILFLRQDYKNVTGESADESLYNGRAKVGELVEITGSSFIPIMGTTSSVYSQQLVNQLKYALTTLKTLQTIKVRSALVYRIASKLSSNKVTPFWIPGHSGKNSFIKADVLPGQLPEVFTEYSFPTLFQAKHREP